jgi:hypothetical protein
MSAMRMIAIILAGVTYGVLKLPPDVSAQVVIPEVRIPDISVRSPELPKEGGPKGFPFSIDSRRQQEFSFDFTRPQPVSNGSDDQIVIGMPIAGCPLVFLKVNIHSYKLIYRRRYAAVLADDNSPLHQDVCECRLMPGDYRACALKTIASKATPISTTPPPDYLLQGIQIAITDAQEFEKLFADISSKIPAHQSEIATAFTNDGSGGANGKPPTRPPSQNDPLQVNKPESDDSNKCERSAKICISPNDGKVSAEFSVKCKNMPEFTFSTDGEASMKLGHVSVSFSAN